MNRISDSVTVCCVYAVVSLEEKDSVVHNFSVRVDFWSNCAAGDYGNADLTAVSAIITNASFTEKSFFPTR